MKRDWADVTKSTGREKSRGGKEREMEEMRGARAL